MAKQPGVQGSARARTPQGAASGATRHEAAPPQEDLPILNIAGCGRVGRTLAALWSAAGVLRIGAVLNRSLASGERALAFIGAGTAVASAAELPPADVLLIGVPDDGIEAAAQALAGAPLPATRIALHCSGALDSGALQALAQRGIRAASAHPLKSFADPEAARRSFAGTFCGVEGDAEARAFVAAALTRIGAVCFELAPQDKLLYHTAGVFLSNYVCALLEVGLATYERAGIPRERAAALVRPLLEESVANGLALGPAAALTGPIARGDHALVARELDTLRAWRSDYAELYRALGAIALQLAAAQAGAAPERDAALAELLRDEPRTPPRR